MDQQRAYDTLVVLVGIVAINSLGSGNNVPEPLAGIKHQAYTADVTHPEYYDSEVVLEYSIAESVNSDRKNLYRASLYHRSLV